MDPPGQPWFHWLSRRFWGFPLFLALIETMALAVHLQNVDMVGQAVQQCSGQAFGTEDFRPFIERQVGGDDLGVNAEAGKVSCGHWVDTAGINPATGRRQTGQGRDNIVPYLFSQNGFVAERVIGDWINFYTAERPHSSLDDKTPGEAYWCDRPVDMMDKADALTTYSQAQQRQEDTNLNLKKNLAA